MKRPPREITDRAIDCALHRLPDPKNGWEDLLPPDDLGEMVSAGSGQIGLQALGAALEYGPRPWAVRTLNTYADLCWSRFMLSEPWSAIYGQAIVACWVAFVVLATRHGEAELAGRFRELVAAWAGTCRLMEAQLNGRPAVLTAGCRSWGHKPHGNFDKAWPIAAAYADPPRPGTKAYGKPGAYDDWGWILRCYSIGADVLRAAAHRFVGLTIPELLAAIPRWAARTEMQLLGYADGSRLWLMGDDEAEMDDEDENGNTAGVEAAGVLAGVLIWLPWWPDTATGKTRIRQTNVQADLDGDPVRGWDLWNSHLGQRRGNHPKTGEAGFLSRLEPYTKAPLVFWQTIRAGNRTWIDMLAQGSPGVPIDPDGSPGIPPAPPGAPHPPRPPKPPWWRRTKKAMREWREDVAEWEALWRSE